MQPSTITKVRAHLPATVYQLAERMGCTASWARDNLRELARLRYVEPWGQDLGPCGTLVQVFEATDKEAGHVT